LFYIPSAVAHCGQIKEEANYIKTFFPWSLLMMKVKKKGGVINEVVREKDDEQTTANAKSYRESKKCAPHSGLRGD